MTRVSVKPELLRWASERAGKRESALTEKFAAFPEWLAGKKAPTFKQLEDFAKATHTPFGFFFLSEPPVETIPIPDFRTVGSVRAQQPSPDLLDTIYLCQQRQDWYRQNALVLGEPPLGFIGSATLQSDVVSTAARIRRTVGFDLDARAETDTFVEALRMMITAADEAGILVMVSGIVGHNSHRPLDTAEFRGFALSDDRAPLVFINGTDTKSGQMFTLAHELAHLWLGQSGVSDVTAASSPMDEMERWCHAVATELACESGDACSEGGGRRSKRYISERFARALLASTWSDRTTFSEAFRLLECRNVKALESLRDRLGVVTYRYGEVA